MYQSIRRFSEAAKSSVESGEIDDVDAAIRDTFNENNFVSLSTISPPSEPNPVPQKPATKEVSPPAKKQAPKASRKSVAKRVTIAAVDENVPQHHIHEDVNSDYSLRDGSSMEHLAERLALVKTPAKRAAPTPSKRVSTPAPVLLSPYDAGALFRQRQTPFNKKSVIDDDTDSVSTTDSRTPSKLIYRRN
jgi:hypothetical protein